LIIDWIDVSTAFTRILVLVGAPFRQNLLSLQD